MRHNPLPSKASALIITLSLQLACSFVNRQVYLLPETISTPDVSAKTLIGSTTNASFNNSVISIDVVSPELYTRVCEGPPYLPIIPSFSYYGNQPVIDLTLLKDRQWTQATLEPEMFRVVAAGATYQPDLYAFPIDIQLQSPTALILLNSDRTQSNGETVRLKYPPSAMGSTDAELRVSNLIVDKTTVSFTVKMRQEVRWRFEPYYKGNW